MSEPLQFFISVLGAQVWDPTEDNIDVVVELADRKRFAATFFTPRNIERLFEKNRLTGECANGLYLWSANMILVRQITMDIIRRTVADLIESGEFERAFARIDDAAP